MSKVAIIDSGIDERYAVCKLNVVQSLTVSISEDDETKEFTGSKCKNPHGTIIADVITQINSNVEIIDINILNEKLETNGYVLLRAIEKAIDLKPDVINLSLGTNSLRYTFSMMKQIKRAIRNNILMVAAYDNNNRITFPATFRDVIGVKKISSLSSSSDNFLWYLYQKDIYYAPGENYYIHELNDCKSKYIMSGNSISTAYITGELTVLKDRYKELSMKEIIAKFKCNILSKEKIN